MALSTPSVLDTAIDNANNSTIVSASISPTAGALLIVCYAGQSSIAGIGATITDGLTGTGSWTHVLVEHDTGDSAYCVVGWALVGPSPGSGAVTFTFDNNLFREVLACVEVTGQHATPVPQSQSGGNALSTLALVLGSSPASDSTVLGAVQSRSGGVITPGTGFTELVDQGTTADVSRLQVQYDETSPDDTVDWSDLNTLGNAGVAIEIAAAAVGGEEFSERSYPRGASRGVMRGAA